MSAAVRVLDDVHTLRLGIAVRAWDAESSGGDFGLADALNAVLDLCAETHQMGRGSLTARQVRDAIRDGLGFDPAELDQYSRDEIADLEMGMEP